MCKQQILQTFVYAYIFKEPEVDITWIIQLSVGPSISLIQPYLHIFLSWYDITLP